MHQDTLFTYLQQYITLTTEEINTIKKSYSTLHITKGTLLLAENTISTHMYFLSKGAIRLFYNVEGNQKTAYFYLNRQFICAGESYTHQIPCTENFEALEDSEVLVFDKAAINTLLQKYPKLEIIGRIAVETELINYQQLVKLFVTQSPEKRYLALIEHNGSLFNRVPQQYIATYLGISPETLSRIKKRVLSKRDS